MSVNAVIRVAIIFNFVRQIMTPNMIYLAASAQELSLVIRQWQLRG